MMIVLAQFPHNANAETSSVQLEVNPAHPIMINPLFFSATLTAPSIPLLNGDPRFEALTKLLRPNLIRFPAGSDKVYWDRSGKYNWWEAPAPYQYSISPTVIDNYITFCRNVGAVPFIQVDMYVDAPALWADLVKYVNVERGYNVTYWSMGNEPQFIDNYTKEFGEYATAMKNVDPTIRFSAPEYAGIVPAAAESFASQYGKDIFILSQHQYALGGEDLDPSSQLYPTIQNLLTFDATNPPWAGIDFMPKVAPSLLDIRDRYLPSGLVGVTEWGPSYGLTSATNPTTDSMGTALWLADTIGRLGRSGIDLFCYWALATPNWSTFKDALISHTENPYLIDQVRAQYYAFLLYRQWWGNYWLGTSTTDDAHLSVWASASDNHIFMMVVNKQLTSDMTASVTVDAHVSNVKTYALNSANYNSTTVSINGVAIDLTNPTTIDDSIAHMEPTASPATPTFTYTFPAHSVIVFDFTLQGTLVVTERS
jgi:hypothetical protein